MRVLVSGGGTAGHINPALAVCRELIDVKNAKILFVGTKKGLEATLVPKENINIEYIEVDGLIRRLTLKNISVAYRYLKAVKACEGIIRSFKPDVVIGTGGYVCAPVLKAAAKLKVPSIIHEQNVIPGVTVKQASKTADYIAMSFSDTVNYMGRAAKKKCVLCGNPIRKAMLSTKYDEARKKLCLDGRRFIVMFGGSLGAEKLNDVLVDLVNNYDLSGFNFLFGTGKRYFDEVMKKINKSKLTDRVRVEPYIYDMETVLPAADLVIARSGALTVSELNAMGKPSILIPSPNVAHNHQEFNARALQNNNAAVMLKESELTAKKLYELICGTDKKTLSKMAEASKKMGICDATQKICSLCDKLI